MSRSRRAATVLLADTVSYNQRTGTITASGNVSLVQPTGEVVFSEFIELRDSMNTGFRAERAHAARRPLASRGERGAARSTAIGPN